MDDFIALSHARHACKLFNQEKIPDATLYAILEAGRLAPSSFGMEPWKFLVVQTPELKEAIRPLCWNQPQITTCSDLVILIAENEKILPDAPYVAQKFRSRGLDETQTQNYLKRYGDHLTKTHLSQPSGITAWTRAQCYIAATAMMYAAASMGVDSCPIEGFEPEKLEALLNIDSPNRAIVLLLPLGYRAQAITPKRRNDFETVVEFC